MDLSKDRLYGDDHICEINVPYTSLFMLFASSSVISFPEISYLFLYQCIWRSSPAIWSWKSNVADKRQNLSKIVAVTDLYSYDKDHGLNNLVLWQGSRLVFRRFLLRIRAGKYVVLRFFHISRQYVEANAATVSRSGCYCFLLCYHSSIVICGLS